MMVGSAIMRIDRIGRVSIPVDFRRILGIKHNDLIEILVDGDSIVLRKHDIEEVCVFCGYDEPIIYKNQLVCISCLENLKNR